MPSLDHSNCTQVRSYVHAMDVCIHMCDTKYYTLYRYSLYSGYHHSLILVSTYLYIRAAVATPTNFPAAKLANSVPMRPHF